MKFVIKKASLWGQTVGEVEISSLDELKEIAAKYTNNPYKKELNLIERVIVDFNNGSIRIDDDHLE